AGEDAVVGDRHHPADRRPDADDDRAAVSVRGPLADGEGLPAGGLYRPGDAGLRETSRARGADRLLAGPPAGVRPHRHRPPGPRSARFPDAPGRLTGPSAASV